MAKFRQLLSFWSQIIILLCVVYVNHKTLTVGGSLDSTAALHINIYQKDFRTFFIIFFGLSFSVISLSDYIFSFWLNPILLNWRPDLQWYLTLQWVFSEGKCTQNCLLFQMNVLLHSFHSLSFREWCQLGNAREGAKAVK